MVIRYNRAMPFGKYKGEIVSEVMYEDPEYFRWLLGNLLDVDLCEDCLAALPVLEKQALRRRGKRRMGSSIRKDPFGYASVLILCTIPKSLLLLSTWS